MNFLYWNLHRNKKIIPIVTECIKERNVDVFLCSEFLDVPLSGIIDKLPNYKIVDGIEGDVKVKIICKSSLNITILREQNRYLIAKLTLNNNSLLITGVHLPDNRNSDANDRKNIIRKIISDIIDKEKELFLEGAPDTLVVGDMNANPFDSEIVGKDSFNAVLYKGIIEKDEFIQYQGDVYQRFYNPAIHYLSETNQCYGSYYYSSGNSPLYWNCYDQVLVRKNLINKIENYTYLKQVGNHCLVSRTRPRVQKISDHLPLFFALNF